MRRRLSSLKSGACFEEPSIASPKKAFRGETPPKLSLTVLEAVLVGVARNLDALRAATVDVVASRFDALVKHEDFSELSLKEGLSKKPRVIARLNTAARIFAGN